MPNANVNAIRVVIVIVPVSPTASVPGSTTKSVTCSVPQNNTNVIELHNQILKEGDDPIQLMFYSCGIGAYVPPNTCWLVAWYQNMVDMAIARNFREIIGKAYRWLADKYQDGGRIFMFGIVFRSMRAYQVQALTGLIEQVGLVSSGNTGLIPFAYELYAKRYRGEGKKAQVILFSCNSLPLDIKDKADARALAENFKQTFSREVKVHFIGVWWTPNLQLDKYFGTDDKLMNTKEVWFVGSHSDVGGGLQALRSLGLVSLLWMENQAIDAGLHFGPWAFVGEWMWDNLHKSKPTISLHSYWKLAEILPL
ncbi:hypothetical protein EDD18DRAFT_1115607 [Armillaria luteobubalina]|uniref:T6SS Phospholipase effector Tle1-like catalytic domain-containing protein n=1 Tax=Armillaria luteobubalina TaxID=153913 RepID=A0AA39U2N2_9AGAR|nr:hypothetical protein EDD18DRAFT_1115607 [Armillaria luteobubalina]